MPIHGAHVLDPGGERNQMVIWIPGRIRVGHFLFRPAFRHLVVGMRLGVRKEPYKKKKKDKDMIPEGISL
jgi:hypothetical protein